jgi:hypothetical protein
VHAPGVTTEDGGVTGVHIETTEDGGVTGVHIETTGVVTNENSDEDNPPPLGPPMNGNDSDSDDEDDDADEGNDGIET